MEKVLSSEFIYKGKIVNLRIDDVEIQNGRRVKREVVEHSGGVGVLAFDRDGNVLMVRQFRHGIGRESLEIPAGKLEPGEDPALCGIRELEEETGYRAASVEPLGTLDPTPAYDSEVIHLFLAGELTYAGQNLDENEVLSVERVPLERAVGLCLNGGVTDAKTVIAILKYAAMNLDSHRVGTAES